MKKYILLFVLSAFILYVTGQQSDEAKKPGKKITVPQPVLKAFSAKYPQATKVKWGLEKPGEYEAEFLIGGNETSAVYEEEGILLAEETEMEESSLPQSIKDALAKDFKDCKIDEVEKVSAKDVTTFEMEAKCGKTKSELVFDTNGKLISKEEMKPEDKND
jgi:hypothetical protein